MDTCCICGTIFKRDNKAFPLSKQLDDHFVCEKCHANLLAVRRLAMAGDKQYELVVQELIDRFNDGDPDDETLEYIERYIRRTKREYKNQIEDHNDELARLTIYDPPAPNLNRRKLLIGIGIGIALLVAILVFVCNLSKNYGEWICDRCNVVFSGKAYYGINGTETMCEDCAKEYWMPLSYQNYVKDPSEQKPIFNSSNDSQQNDTTRSDRNKPSEAELDQFRRDAQLNSDGEIYWIRNDVYYHFDRDCQYIRREKLIGDGGNMMCGTIDDAFSNECWYPCSACAGGQGEADASHEASDIYVAYGSFSEGKAYAQVEDIGGCYIDQTGQILFALPDDMPYGYQFSEGYAVVTNRGYHTHTQYDLEWGLEDRNYGDEVKYALINENGSYVVEPGRYVYISSVSEGKYFCVSVERAASGTTTTYLVNDIHGNTICTISGGQYPWYDKLNNQALITDEQLYIFFGSHVDTYDLSGKKIADTDDPTSFDAGNAHARVVKTGFIACSSSLGSRYIMDLSNGATTRIESVAQTDGAFSLGGYIMQQKKLDSKRVAWLVNTAGEIVSDPFELAGADGWATNVDNGLWVVKLSNGYWGVIAAFVAGNKLKLAYLFEPIQDSLLYIGESHFYGQNTRTVYDGNGQKCYIMPSDMMKIAENYSEGYLVAAFGRCEKGDYAGYERYYYIDYQGNILTSLTELGEYGASG